MGKGTKSRFNGSALHLVCRAGDSDACVNLLRHDVNARRCINLVDNEGFTPLHYACKYGKMEMVEALLWHGARRSMYQKDDTGRTTLHYACVGSSLLHTVEILLRCNSAITIVDKSGCTPLHYACKSGYSGMVETLLRHGANMSIQKQDRFGHTPLHYACKMVQPPIFSSEVSTRLAAFPCEDGVSVEAYSDGIRIVELLLLHGAGEIMHNVDVNGKTPLHYACMNRSFEIVEMLARHDTGNCINTRDKDWRTALHYACSNESFSIVEALLIHGAKDSILKRDKFGYTPLQHACVQKSVAIVEILMQNVTKHSINMSEKDGRTALHYACEYGCLSMVETLLIHGAGKSMHKLDGTGRTPLHYACARKSSEMVEMLMQQATAYSVKMKDKEGRTALHYACRNGSLCIVRALLLHGAKDSIFEKDKLGYTPLHYAWENVPLCAPLYSQWPSVDEEGRDCMHIVEALLQQDAVLVMEALTQFDTEIENAKDIYGCTLLHCACENGSLFVIDTLLRYGAEPSIQIKKDSGYTPLHCALKHNHLSACGHLYTRARGDWALLLACTGTQNTKEDVAKAMDKLWYTVTVPSSCEWLWNHGVREGINQNSNGYSPVYFACECQRFDVANWLFEHGAKHMNFQHNRIHSFSHADGFDWYVRHYSSDFSHEDTVQMFYEGLSIDHCKELSTLLRLCGPSVVTRPFRGHNKSFPMSVSQKCETLDERIIETALRIGVPLHFFQHVDGELRKVARRLMADRQHFIETFLYGCRQSSGSINLSRCLASKHMMAVIRREVGEYAGVVVDVVEWQRVLAACDWDEGGSCTADCQTE